METQVYSIVRKETDFEIRYYPEATLAEIKVNSASYKELGNKCFKRLAGFILGGNHEKKQIAMTSPVHMEMGYSGKGSMAFVLPSTFQKDSIPHPNDSSIMIKTSKAEYVSVIEFGGFANVKKITKKMEKLKAILAENLIIYTGNLRYLKYNQPYRLFGRKNEIIVSIDYTNK